MADKRATSGGWAAYNIDSPPAKKPAILHKKKAAPPPKPQQPPSKLQVEKLPDKTPKKQAPAPKQTRSATTIQQGARDPGNNTSYETTIKAYDPGDNSNSVSKAIQSQWNSDPSYGNDPNHPGHTAQTWIGDAAKEP